jgi:hypothetical protein
MYNDNAIKQQLTDLFSKLDQADKEMFLKEMIKEHDVFHMTDDFLVRFYDHVKSRRDGVPSYIKQEEIDAFLNSN